MNFPFRLPEMDAVRAALGRCEDGRILEVGSGAGAMTAMIARTCRPVATERFSDALNRNTARDLADFVQSEPDFLPFPDHHFRNVVCTQVIDRLPGPDRRAQALAEMARVTEESGRLLLTVLHQNHRFDGFGMAKEGYSEGDYYYRFYLPEFRSLVEEHWTIERLWGVWTYLPRTYPIYTRLGRAVVYWERALRQTSLARRYGKMLLAVCRPRNKQRKP